MLLLSNTFNIALAVFEVTKSVVNKSTELIGSSTTVTPGMLANLKTTLQDIHRHFVKLVKAVHFCKIHDGRPENRGFRHRVWAYD